MAGENYNSEEKERERETNNAILGLIGINAGISTLGANVGAGFAGTIGLTLGGVLSAGLGVVLGYSVARAFHFSKEKTVLYVVSGIIGSGIGSGIAVNNLNYAKEIRQITPPRVEYGSPRKLENQMVENNKEGSFYRLKENKLEDIASG